MPADVLDGKAAAERLDPGRPGSRCGAPDDGRRPGDGGSGLLGDYRLFGLWAFLGTISMMFMGLTSAYMVRRASPDWQPLSPPGLLWANTALLLLSSAALEAARRRLRAWDLPGMQLAVAATGLFGALFVLGQYGAWRQLAAQGIYLASNPASSFFYLLTGLHALHLLGGLAWFSAVLLRARRMAFVPGEDGLRLFAHYWHFLAALWVYLFLLLFVL
jgi:cytochrome c oxidase subunit 3